MQRILIVKLGDLGDLLLVSPALAALHEAHPTARLDLLVPPRSVEVARHIPQVDEVIAIAAFDRPRDLLQPGKWLAQWRFSRQLRRNHYDAVLIMQHMTTALGAAKFALLTLAAGVKVRAGLDNGRGWFLNRRVRNRGYGAQHEADYWLAVAALVGADPRPRPSGLLVAAADDSQAALLLAPLADHRPRVAMHLGTGAYAPARRWPLASFIELAQRLQAEGAAIILVGGADVREFARQLVSALAANGAGRLLNLVEQTTVSELAAVLRHCDLYVGSDSGPLHVAATAGVAVLGIYGPSNERAWGPYAGGTAVQFDALTGTADDWRAMYSGGNAVIRQSLACSPCLYREWVVGLRDGCPDRECLTTLEPVAVHAAARLLLAKVGHTPESSLPRPYHTFCDRHCSNCNRVSTF